MHQQKTLAAQSLLPGDETFLWEEKIIISLATKLAPPLSDYFKNLKNFPVKVTFQVPLCITSSVLPCWSHDTASSFLYIPIALKILLSRKRQLG